MSGPACNALPEFDTRLARISLATLPTPVEAAELSVGRRRRKIWIKRDDLSAQLYGGNKVRKLEYIFARALERGATRIATFGTVASNHALATAIYARHLGLDCTCLLAHQDKSVKAREVLRAHVALGTELVYYGGGYPERVATMRRCVQGRNCWVIPVGGSSWLGCIGFVNAARELAEQVANDRLPCPDVIYVATGTMGTAAGLALGLTLAGLPTKVEAIRVTDERFANRAALERLIHKTAMMMRRRGAEIPEGVCDKVRICLRDEFFAGGYTKSDDATEAAVSLAASGLTLQLETTYTGKAMAALIHDIARGPRTDGNVLFWNTYNSRPLPDIARGTVEAGMLPAAFRRYLD